MSDPENAPHYPQSILNWAIFSTLVTTAYGCFILLMQDNAMTRSYVETMAPAVEFTRLPHFLLDLFGLKTSDGYTREVVAHINLFIWLSGGTLGLLSIRFQAQLLDYYDEMLRKKVRNMPSIIGDEHVFHRHKSYVYVGFVGFIFWLWIYTFLGAERVMSFSAIFVMAASGAVFWLFFSIAKIVIAVRTGRRLIFEEIVQGL